MRSFFILPLLTITTILLSIPLAAQLQIGHTTITFNDPDRDGGFGSGGGPGRQIQTEIYYPADVAGDDVAVSDGSYPVVVFGHGFVMSWDSYGNIWEALVPNGYIVAFPRTEGNFSPDHQDFGLDLALVVDRMQEEGANETSLFFNRVQNASAIMGHSMGGGATFIGAAQTNVQAVIGLASAETNPSAIAAAENVSAPMLMLAASSDDVTPPEEHQIPIYNATSSACKYVVNITGGGHCNFANSNTNCEFGELFSSGNITISREEHHETMNDYILPWLNYWLKGEEPALQNFVDLIWNDDRTTYEENCLVLGLEDNASDNAAVYPNPAGDYVFFDADSQKSVRSIVIYNLEGKIVLTPSADQFRNGINVADLPRGMYTVVVEHEGGEARQYRFVKE